MSDGEIREYENPRGFVERIAAIVDDEVLSDLEPERVTRVACQFVCVGSKSPYAMGKRT